MLSLIIKISSLFKMFKKHIKVFKNGYAIFEGILIINKRPVPKEKLNNKNSF